MTRDHDPVQYVLRVAVCFTLAVAAHLVAVLWSRDEEDAKPSPETQRIIASFRETVKDIQEILNQPPPEPEPEPEQPKVEPEPPKAEPEPPKAEPEPPKAEPEPPKAEPAPPPPPPPPAPTVPEPMPEAPKPDDSLADVDVSVVDLPPPPVRKPPEPTPPPPQPPPPPPPPPTPPPPLAEPVREPEPLPPPPKPEPPKPEPPKPEPRREPPKPEPRREPPKPEPRREPPKPEPRREPPRPAPPAPAPTPPPPVVRRPPPPAPAPLPPEIGAESVTARDQRLAQTMNQLDDFQQFATSSRDEVKGPIPAILFTNDDEAEWLGLIAHFDMLPIAYAKSDPTYYITIDVARRQLQHTRDFGFIQQRYATRSGMMLRQLGTMPAFAETARVIMSQFSIRPSDLTIQFLMPRPFAAYLNWKALKTCHEQGADPATVKACLGRLVREGDRWVWRVDQLLLEDGQTTRVRRAG